MSKLNLAQSPVVFNQEEHTYHLLDGTKLEGITSSLIKRAFPDTYKGISEHTLRRAAEHGSVVHETIELFETIFNGDIKDYTGVMIPELHNYIRLKADNNLTHQAQEYLVSDNRDFASAIDVVYTDDNDDITLCDIKTTSKLMYDHVSLQLSIYAMLFEMMNPDLKVSHLTCMWLHKEGGKYVEVPRVSDDKIKDLMDAYLNGMEDYHYEVEIPDDFVLLEEQYLSVTAQVNQLKEQQDELRAKLMSIMESKKMKKIKTPFCSYNFIPSTTKETFDAKSFKESNPDMYKKYIKETTQKSQIKITINK